MTTRPAQSGQSLIGFRSSKAQSLEEPALQTPERSCGAPAWSAGPNNGALVTTQLQAESASMRADRDEDTHGRLPITEP